MKCPLCNNDLIKQRVPDDGLQVHENPIDVFDFITQWYKCSSVYCPMAIYLSNEVENEKI